MDGSTTRRVPASDGVELAVYEDGDRDRPTVLLVHGYPDDHTVWEPLIPHLAERFHVVASDVRGTGASGEPAGREGYRLAQLCDDLAAVIAATSPDAPVHLVAHDWGSVQSWGAVTDRAFATRLASFTSISGPSFDMAGLWVRNGFRHPVATLRQVLASWYIFAFQLPRLPEWLVHRGVLQAMVARSERTGAPPGRHRVRRSRRDAINGIELYRANIHRLFAPRRPDPAVCPVLVLAPTGDPHVTAPLALEAPVPFVPDLTARTVPGNHWVVAQDPALIARLVTGFVDLLPAAR